MSTSLYSLGRWAFRHPLRVLGAWALVLLVTGGIALGLGGATQDEFEIPGTESQEAINGLERTFPELSGAGAYLVVVAPDGRTVDDERSTRLIESAMRQMKKVNGVTDVVSPFSDLTDIGVSEDKRAAQVLVQFDRDLTDVTDADRNDLAATDRALVDAGYTTAFGGDVFTNTGPQLSIIEVIGVVIAFIVLYLMFRSLRAAVMPIVTALLGVMVAMALTFIAAAFITISGTAPLLALMIGLAVGIDYALFIVSRHREQLANGLDVEEAAARSVATAGSAVVFAGVTVVIALVGLAIAQIPFLTVMGVVAAVAVVVAVAVAITVIPALLGRAGDKLTPDASHPVGGFSHRWVVGVTRWPWLAIVLVTVGLSVVAIPAKDLQLALPDNGSAHDGSTQRVAYDLVTEHFGPGYNGPLMVSIDIITSLDPVRVVDEIASDLRAMPGVETIGLATPNPTADTGIVQVIPTTSAPDPKTAQLVHDIRDRKAEWKAEHGVDVSVTGLTAGGIDVSNRLQAALVPFGIVVVGLSVLLLMIVFRSIVVPIKATIGFLLSTGASFGAVVAVFQWGWLGDVVMLDQTGPLISFLPIILMAVLFGLSMDYEVFLMSRMKEEYVQSDDPHAAIVDGFVGSSRVVTAAAVIMLAVFAAFVPDGDPNIKPIAFALAIGVFADAFLVRMLLAPAVLEIFGRRSWVLPRRLENKLPHIDVEGEALHTRVELQDWPRAGSDAAITADAVTLHGTDGPVFENVSVDVERGGWLIVHGSGGNGKSALVLTLAGRMAYSQGRLRVCGALLPQETRAVRQRVALAEFAGVNDLEDNLTIDQHIAERLSIRSFGLWVSQSRIEPVRRQFIRALEHAHQRAGLPLTVPSGSTLISDLPRLERTVFGVVLALVGKPHMVVLDDADDVRSSEHIELLWLALNWLLTPTQTALVASVQSASAAPSVGLLERTVTHLDLTRGHPTSAEPQQELVTP